jgi:hypothetical protein
MPGTLLYLTGSWPLQRLSFTRLRGWYVESTEGGGTTSRAPRSRPLLVVIQPPAPKLRRDKRGHLNSTNHPQKGQTKDDGDAYPYHLDCSIQTA